jgi:hypothetical protein
MATFADDKAVMAVRETVESSALVFQLVLNVIKFCVSPANVKKKVLCCFNKQLRTLSHGQGTEQ